MNREDFPILENNKSLIYFDNSATTLKPKSVIEAVNQYYTTYTANAHRGDYDNSIEVDQKYESVRDKVRDFINADNSKEVIFTKGTTDSINMVVFGFMKYYLKDGDEVILSKSEHASNVLPWMRLADEISIKIKYVDLDEDFCITLDNLEKAITGNTKVISLAHISNVIGDVRNLSAIGKMCNDKGIIFVVDAAQSAGHKKIDVKNNNIDFLAFSAHKMFGPTGIGVLYGRFDLLNKMVPTEYGGGMNTFFESTGEVEYKELPERLEAGTPNIAGVVGLGAAIDYINRIEINNISDYEVSLKKYAIEKLRDVKDITIYNENSLSGILIFNIKNIFSQDLAVYLNHYKICVRSGNHCAKMLKDDIKTSNTCRASFSFYNTKEEIDKFVDVLKNHDNIYDIIL